MCITALTLENLDAINTFRYKSTDKSLLYNYILSPILNKVVLLLPQNLSPNVITLFSLSCNIISFMVTQFELYNDFEEPLSRGACFIQFIAQLLYLILDNLDGKQARRTGTSSPYGMLLDHGCDVFTNILVCYNVSHLLMLKNEGPLSFLVFISLLTGFFSLTYEEYVLDELHLGYINGADEGNLVVSLGALVGAIFGGEIYDQEILDLTIGEWIALGLLLATVHTVVMSLFNIFYHRGFKTFLKTFLDWVFYYNVIIAPIINSSFKYLFYADYLWLIYLTISLLFARITIDLQIRVVTRQKIGFSLTLLGVNVALIVSYLFRNRFILLTIYGMSSVALGTEIAMLVVTRSMEILSFLKIRLLCINVPTTENGNTNK